MEEVVQVSDDSNASFVEHCPICKATITLRYVDLYNSVLGKGVKKYSFPQYCDICKHFIGQWTCTEHHVYHGHPVLEFAFSKVKPREVWKPTIWMNPPRRSK